MTSVGHSLTGMSIAVLCLPRQWSVRVRLIGMLTFAMLACVPDVRFHEQYHIRHSLLVNVAMMAGPVLLLTLWDRMRRRIGGWRTVYGGCAAWLSHLLLDSFYNHGLGVPVGWPFGRWRPDLAIPFFECSRPWEGLSPHNLRVLSIELAFYGALLLLCLWISFRLKRHAAMRAPLPPEKT